jgi:hypothetical protein
MGSLSTDSASRSDVGYSRKRTPGMYEHMACEAALPAD